MTAYNYLFFQINISVDELFSALPDAFYHVNRHCKKYYLSAYTIAYLNLPIFSTKNAL